jgi:cellobiose-specific phosphotransferase system component IIC
MAIATFAFGVAYVVMSDAAVRRISGVLMAVSAALMTAAAIAGIGRADDIAIDASPGAGLWLTLVAGVIGMISGVLAVRASRAADTVDVRAPASTEM